MVLVGALWLVNTFWESDYGLAARVRHALRRPVLGRLPAPAGRVPGGPARLGVRAAHGPLPVDDRLPRRRPAGGLPTRGSTTATVVRTTRSGSRTSPGTANALEAISTVIGLLVFVGLLVLLVRRWRRRPRRSGASSARCTSRRGVAVALVAILFAVGSFSSAVRLGARRRRASRPSGLVPLFFLAGLLRTRLYRAAVAAAARGSRTSPTPEEIAARAPQRPRRSRPSSSCTWLDEAGGYVDTRGNPAVLQPDTPRRATTRIDDERAGRSPRSSTTRHSSTSTACSTRSSPPPGSRSRRTAASRPCAAARRAAARCSTRSRT